MKILKKVLLIGLLALIVGALIFVIFFAVSGWNFKNLSSVVVQNEIYTENSENKISTVNIDYDNADVEIVFSDVDTLTVSYPKTFTRSGKPASEIHLSDSDGELSITSESIWHRNIGINWVEEKVYITVPTQRACDLNIKTDNGDILVCGGEGSTVVSAFFDTDNGDIDTERATLVSEGELYFTTSNGEIDAGKLYANKLTMETDNGDISLRGGEITGEVYIGTDNGDVELEGDLKAMSLKVETDNGEISLTNGTISADKIILNSDNGDIEAKILGRKSDYSISVNVSLGDSNIANTSGGTKTLEVGCDIGDIEIYFTEN